MRADIVAAVQARLAGLAEVAMVCGLGVEKPAYPLVRVWAKGTPESNLDNAPQARIDLRLVVQIETYLETDEDGRTDETALYGAVDAVFTVLHGYQLPGRGSQPIIMFDHPGLLDLDADKRAIYQLQASVRVLPDLFSLTI